MLRRVYAILWVAEITSFTRLRISLQASLNMTDSSTPLQKQMHVFRQFSTDPFCSCDLLDACVAEAIHGTEPPQQQIFPVLTHPRTIVENALLDTLFHEQLMICVSESMRFIPNALK